MNETYTNPNNLILNIQFFEYGVVKSKFFNSKIINNISIHFFI